MQIEVCGNRALIRQVQLPATTAGGLIVPDSARKLKSEGTVMAVGSGKRLGNGLTLAPPIKKGDHVVFGEYTGTPVTFDGKDYLIVEIPDIHAILT